MENLARQTIICIGEQSPTLSSIVNWGSTHDASYFYTEGMFRALFLRIRRLMFNDDFEYGKVYPIDNDEDILLFCRNIGDRKTVFAVILRTANCLFNDALIEIIRNVAFRSGIYSAKKFHAEIYEAFERHYNNEYDEDMKEAFTPMEALVYLETKNLINQSKEFLTGLIDTLTSQSSITKYLHSKPVFQAALLMLSKILEEDDPDIFLDSAYLLAGKYKDATRFYNAFKLFDKVAGFAERYERLSLQISCRVQQADIIKIQDGDLDVSEILTLFADIDDGSLEVAQPLDRELFYCLQGFAYDKMNDPQTAHDYYLMATMVAESEGGFSIYLAEAHVYLGDAFFKKFDVISSVRSYMTAASVARANQQESLATIYSHKAGLAEIEWAKMLASTAMVVSLDGKSDAAHYAWMALKHLLKSISYMSRDLRTATLPDYYHNILTLCQNVLEQTYDESTTQTLKELAENYQIFVNASLEVEEESDLVEFLKIKVDSKLPLPEPVIMVIANDGRFILGGLVVETEEDTQTSFTGNDDLFSGALTAIMAIFGEVVKSANPLKMIDAGSTSIMIERSKNCIGALLVDRDLSSLRHALRDVLASMENSYPKLSDWDGYSLDFSSMREVIHFIFAPALRSVNL